MGQVQPKLIYSTPLGQKKEGESQIYRNPKTSDELHWKPEPHISNL